eukprot:1540202-Pyramimonas_sp.AAC.1
MLSGAGAAEGELLITRAVRTAAVYKLHGTFRHSNQAAVTTPDALTQVVRGIVRSHPRAARAVGRSFVS